MKSNLEKSRDALTDAIAELGRQPRVKGDSAERKGTAERIKIYVDYLLVDGEVCTCFCSSTIQSYRHECRDTTIELSMKQAIASFMEHYTFQHPTTLYLHNKKLFRYASTRRFHHPNFEVELMPKEQLEGHWAKIFKQVAVGTRNSLTEIIEGIDKVRAYSLIPG